MTLTKYALSLAFCVLAVVVLFVLNMFFQPHQTYASAPSGLQATVATTSSPAVTSTAALVFATSTCAARVISTTGASGIMIGFSDAQGFVPTGSIGHWQAASTTIAYDSGQYGCGAVRIYSGINQTLTVMESR